MKPTLLILAAGLGSRYGGIKQMDGIGPNGETIIDYSIYDAIKAGFGKIVFIINEKIEKDFKEIFEKLYNKSAYFVMKNTSKLTTREFEEIKVESGAVEEVEAKIIKEHLGQIKISGMDAEKEEKLVKEMINVLDVEKGEGERVADFEHRIKESADVILDSSD